MSPLRMLNANIKRLRKIRATVTNWSSLRDDLSRSGGRVSRDGKSFKKELKGILPNSINAKLDRAFEFTDEMEEVCGLTAYTRGTSPKPVTVATRNKLAKGIEDLCSLLDESIVFYEDERDLTWTMLNLDSIRFMAGKKAMEIAIEQLEQLRLELKSSDSSKIFHKLSDWHERNERALVSAGQSDIADKLKSARFPAEKAASHDVLSAINSRYVLLEARLEVVLEHPEQFYAASIRRDQEDGDDATSNQPPGNSKAGADILLYVALTEEFSSVLSTLGGNFSPFELDDIAITCFRGWIQADKSGRDFAVLVIPTSRMGNTHSANVVSAIITKFKPNDVVVIGIAGSVANELQPGDVFIPAQVNEYLANSATVGDGKDDWKFEISGNHFSTNPRLLNRLAVYPHTNKESFERWLQHSNDAFNRIVTEDVSARLREAKLDLRSCSAFVAGDDRVLASGPAVGKGKAFVNWLKQHVDRKTAAIEMESAGVYDAALIRVPAPRTIAIRGISDFADERKEKLEQAAKEGFRRLAVQNAVTLFMSAVRAGVFAQDSPPS